MSSSGRDKRLVRPDGAKIVDFRRARAWSQQDLANKTGAAKRTIERAEASRPTYVRIVGYIALALGVQPIDLMMSEEPIGSSAPPKHKQPFIFISYAHTDAPFADAFSERLAKAGVPHFRDVKAIAWGEDISEMVHRALEQATHLVVLISPASSQSQWVPYEMGYARGRDVVLIPYLLHPSMILPNFIASRRYLKTPEDEALFIARVQEDLKLFNFRRAAQA